MNRISTFRAAMVALVPMVAIALGRRRAGAIAGAIRLSGGEPAGIAGAGRIAPPRAAPARSGCPPPGRNQITGRSAGDRPVAVAPAARRQRPDRRSLRRAVHAGAQEGGDHEGHRQLGCGVRHPDRFVQGADRAARQAGHQGIRQSDDRLHLDRRYRLHLPRRNSGRPGAEEPDQGHEHGQIARRQGAEVRPSRLLRQHGQHLRGDHQSPRRQEARGQGHLHRGIHHRSR